MFLAMLESLINVPYGYFERPGHTPNGQSVHNFDTLVFQQNRSSRNHHKSLSHANIHQYLAPPNLRIPYSRVKLKPRHFPVATPPPRMRFYPILVLTVVFLTLTSAFQRIARPSRPSKAFQFHNVHNAPPRLGDKRFGDKRGLKHTTPTTLFINKKRREELGMNDDDFEYDLDQVRRARVESAP